MADPDRLAVLKRAAKNREIRRENLREQLQSNAYLREIHKCLEDLAEPGLDGNETKRLTARYNGYLRLLQKTLPDLKAVELDATVSRDEPNRAEMENFLKSVGLLGGGASE